MRRWHYHRKRQVLHRLIPTVAEREHFGWFFVVVSILCRCCCLLPLVLAAAAAAAASTAAAAIAATVFLAVFGGLVSCCLLSAPSHLRHSPSPRALPDPPFRILCCFPLFVVRVFSFFQWAAACGLRNCLTGASRLIFRAYLIMSFLHALVHDKVSAFTFHPLLPPFPIACTRSSQRQGEYVRIPPSLDCYRTLFAIAPADGQNFRVRESVCKGRMPRAFRGGRICCAHCPFPIETRRKQLRTC